MAAVSYWIFSCRDLSKTPAKGLGKWSYLGSAIAQSGTISSTVDEYSANLASRLKTAAPIPSRFGEMLTHEENERIVLFGTRTEDGLKDIVEPTPGSKSPILLTPADVLQDLLAQGIHESDIVRLAKPAVHGGMPFVIQMHCQVADQIFGYQAPTEEKGLEMETTAAWILKITTP